MDTRQGYRHYGPSFFFPIALITVGVVWLLVNNGMVAAENLYRLLPLWPALLIAGGIALLLRRVWWPLGGLVWALVAAFIVYALVAAPGILPSVNTVEARHVTLNEPLEKAKSAAVQLDLSINETRIHPLQNSQDLIYADLYVMDNANLDASGSEVKNVRLENSPTDGFNFMNFRWIGQASRPWDIGLTLSIPLNLTVDASTGSTNMDLTGMKLEGLTIMASTGSMTIILPANQASFPFKVDGSTGSLTIRVPEKTGFDLDLDASTGSLTMNVPADAGMQVVVTSGGTGSLNLPDSMKKVSGESNKKEGTYENDAFAAAKNPIKIRLDMSTGSVTIH